MKKHVPAPSARQGGTTTTLIRAALVALSASLISHSAQAASLSWDGGDATFGGTSGGTGIWDSNTTTNWSNAASEQAWTDTTGVDTAAFGGTAGTVTVSGTVTANKLQLNLTGYTLTGGTVSLSGTTPTVAFGSIASTTINSAISGSNLTFTATTGGFLSLNGNNSGITGVTTLNLGGAAIGSNPLNGASNAASAGVNGGTNNPFGTSTIKFTSAGQINFRNNGDNTATTETINYANNVEINGGNGTFNIGRISGNTTSSNKTFAFGSLTFSTANTFTLAGALSTSPADRISFTGVSLAANGSIVFSATNGVASIGAISETVLGRSFTLSASTTGVTGTTLNLTGASTYTGATNIQSGTLKVGVTNALPSGTTLTLGATGYSAALDLNGFNQTVGGLASAGTLANQSVTNAAAGTGTATLTVNNTVDGTFGGIIKNGATAKVALTKSGAAVFTVTGANTYTGTTTVNGGTLALGASDRLADTSALVLDGGTFATGGFSETLGSLTLSSSSILDFGTNVSGSALAFADSHSIAWTGTLTLLNFDIGTDSLRIGVVSTALTTDQLSKISLSGYAASLDTSGFVTFSAIPEPSTYVSLVGACALTAALCRKRVRGRS